MNLKEDYINFSLENNDIFEELKNRNSMTYDLMYPVIEVLNDLVSKNLVVEGEDPKDVEDCFSVGFRYLYSSVYHIKRILSENFNDDFDELLKFDENLYLYLRIDEIDTFLNESDEMISAILEHLTSSFEYRKSLDKKAIESIEKEIERAHEIMDDEETPDMFIDLADALGIELF